MTSSGHLKMVSGIIWLGAPIKPPSNCEDKNDNEAANGLNANEINQHGHLQKTTKLASSPVNVDIKYHTVRPSQTKDNIIAPKEHGQ